MMYEDYDLAAYGCGRSFYPYLERLDNLVNVKLFCDGNKEMWGKKIFGDQRICVSLEEVKKLEKPFVIITVDDIDAVSELEKTLRREGIPYGHARDIIGQCGGDTGNDAPGWPEKIQRGKIHRFIDLNIVGTTACNFHCEYCYVWRRLGFHGENKLSGRSVEELCNGLSAKRLGGTCFINMCARGETLLAEGIVALTEGLLKEGHFVSIVTNGTFSKTINEILEIPEELLQRLFFKLSFHYRELMRLSLWDTFWDNVSKISRSKCSFTLEITPGDGTEPYIEEIKEMCREKMEGMLPHVSFTRDSQKIGYDLLSNHSVEEYKAVWGQFDSRMFDLKSEWYGRNMKTYQCYAGAWSYLVNAMTGDIKACYHGEPIGNIFDPEMKAFPVEAVRKECRISYCFNNHAFLAWGCVPEIQCATYLDMRDRVSDEGGHWVKEPVYSFMKQKLYENNFPYLDKWPDYERLYKKERGKAFILFNSPDYPNVGDHAIALAEKRFFQNYFPEYDFLEISCSQYVKENSRICSAVRDDDILVITGGGYMGDNYLRLQDISSHIIQTYCNNRIIAAPQSMYFEGGLFSEREKAGIKARYEKHGKMMLAAREEATYTLYQSLFEDTVPKLLVPDMAFFLGRNYAAASAKREGALVCLRTDKESRGLVEKAEIERALDVLDIMCRDDSTVLSSEVMLFNREEKVSDALDRIGHARLVITDRLHCMIFCAITNTPCIVFDNMTGKISETLKWMPKIPNIVLCREMNQVGEAAQRLIASEADYDGRLDLLYGEFDVFAEKIKEFIK